jgi:D-glycero-D-manno-heptose 1,7-bisphosphate phosphatase
MNLDPKYNLVIFDADGTLRRCTVANQPCPNRHGEWELIAGVKEGLAAMALKERGVRIGIASNQAGIAAGYLTTETALDLLHDMFEQAFGFRNRHDFILVCPHDPIAACACRKPNSRMIDDIVFEARSAKRHTLYVGDLETDEKAAKNAGVDFMWAWEFFGKTKEEWVGWLAQRAEEDRRRELDQRIIALGA